MGIFDSVLGGTSTKQQTTSNQIPKWVQAEGQNNYQALKRVVDKPYQPFTGQRVAPLNPTEQAAYGAAAGTINQPTMYGEAANAARNYMTLPKSTIGAPSSLYDLEMGKENPWASIQSYMDPYIQSTLDPIIRQLRENNAYAMNNLGAQATSAGAFGDARQGIEEGKLYRDLGTSIADQTNQVYSQAYQTAMQQRMASIAQALGLKSTDIANLMNQQTQQANLDELFANRQAQGAGLLSGIQDAQTQDQLNRINAAAGAGQAEQANQQAQDDFAYQQYLEARGWDQQSINALMAALSGTPYERSQYQTSTEPNSGASGLLGSALGAILKG